ncbi:MAG: hypothetical protein HHJ15_18100 [Rhodoferax sp.]|uniref:phage scaffolding protein n=1 Tax=Rhodoferax sp. TaxID=50421 RepID=UPI0017ED62EC|nr:hypothetical protein [Rhodoferax sp.]NMM21835.1 hypothetical protein [Rhodoferax sp.]
MRLAKLFPLFENEPGAAGGGSAATPPAKASNETFSREYVNELREENKSWRLKHADSEKLANDYKTSADKATADAKDVTTAAQSAADARVIRAELKTVALKAGMVDLDGLKLADLTTVKLDDKGEVEGADALIEALKKAKPYLFGAAGSSSTPSTPPASTPPAAKSARDMTAEEYAAAKKAKGYR